MRISDERLSWRSRSARTAWVFVCLLVSVFATTAAMAAKQATYYYVDNVGSILVEADGTGVATHRHDYRPYGTQVTDLAEAGPGFTGHVNDGETDLIYMQARYQDPGISRFLSVDPERPSAGDIFGFNRFAYGNNNPISNVDPDGRTVVCGASTCSIESHSLLEAAVDYTTVGVIYAQRLIQNALPTPSESGVRQESHDSVPLPDGLVGTQDGKSGQQGQRVNNGPLDPVNGGTGDSAKDFDKLTGGVSSPAPAGSKYPAGTMVGENGISHRPATAKDGPRIDIPANESKPPETLHYPKPDAPQS